MDSEDASAAADLGAEPRAAGESGSGQGLSVRQGYEAAYRYVAHYYDAERSSPVLRLLETMSAMGDELASNSEAPATWQAAVHATIEAEPLPTMPSPNEPEPHAKPIGLVIGTLDDRRQLAQVSTNVHELLGRQPAELVGSSIIDMIHPGDAARVRYAFGRATSNVNAVVGVRVRDRLHAWQRVTVIVTALHSAESSQLAFVLAPDNEGDESTELERVTELERHLQQIGVEVQAAIPFLTDTASLTRQAGSAFLQRNHPVDSSASPLTAEQVEILRLVGQGYSNHEIALNIHVSTSTIKSHLSQIYRKLRVRGRVEAAVVAKNAGWI